jgi:hypothetical protein
VNPLSPRPLLFPGAHPPPWGAASSGSDCGREMMDTLSSNLKMERYMSPAGMPPAPAPDLAHLLSAVAATRAFASRARLQGASPPPPRRRWRSGPCTQRCREVCSKDGLDTSLRENCVVVGQVSARPDGCAAF